MYNKSLKPMMMIAALGLAVGCSSKKDDNNSNESSKSEIESLGLSGVIDIKVPDSVSGGSGSSSLMLNTTKSMEACQLREQIKEGLAQITSLGDTICHIESSPQIKFGKKYNIKFKMPEGDVGGKDTPPSSAGAPPPALLEDQPSMQLWVDNSGDDTIFYRCVDKTLVDMIKIRKVGEKSVGRFITKGSFSAGDFSNTFHASASFVKDGENKTEIVIKDKMTSKTGNAAAESSSRMLVLKLSGDENGISEVASSFGGSFGGESFDFSSFGRFGPNYGAVIQNVGGQGRRTYFDGDLKILQASAFPDQFGQGKPFYIEDENMPAKLGTSFTPKAFPSDAWDCSGTEDLDLEISEKTINACNEAGFDMPKPTCTEAEGYGFGPAETFEPGDFKDADGFEDTMPAELKEVPDIN